MDDRNDKSKDGMAEWLFLTGRTGRTLLDGRPTGITSADGCTAVCAWGLARPTWRQCSLETPVPEGVKGGKDTSWRQSASGHGTPTRPTELASIFVIVQRPLSAGSGSQNQRLTPDGHP